MILVHGKRKVRIDDLYCKLLLVPMYLFILSNHIVMMLFNIGHAPEAEFLEKLKAIDGVSQVETQTITNMVI